jgi:RimJ/RimL family protein N-acetyltransferase
MKDAGAGLSTQRLTLRRFTAADFEWFHGLNGDPVVKRLMGGPATREGSAAMFRDRVLDYYEAHPGLGIWQTLLRDGGAAIGFHLLNNIQGESDIQVGYMLAQRYWGRGYATEMTLALIRYGLVDRGLPKMAAFTNLANVPSQRVLLKCGLRRNGERSFAHPAYAKDNPYAWFERDAAGWLDEFPAA